MSDKLQAIRAAFLTQRSNKIRHREIASQLDISEGELIAAHTGIPYTDDSIIKVTRLTHDWSAIIESLEPLGEVLALTRNESCVHEKTGVYKDASHNGLVGLVVGEIDLRVFYSQWAHGFAVSEKTEKGEQHSLQFFDKTGTAIHKIFLKPQSHQEAYFALVKHFTDADQSAGLVTLPATVKAEDKPDQEIDVAGFHEAWRNLKDTHAFFGMLRKFNVSRLQGFRLAEKDFAYKVPNDCLQNLLESAVAEHVSIMVFVGNPGMIQIHTGPIEKVALMGPWINVLDPRFNLHLRTDHIAQAWIIKKPTEDGIVTSLELFDQHGDTIAMLFGERKPGKQELAGWRALIDEITKEPVHA